MRHIVFAPSFSREADDIAAYIDKQFGKNASDEFISNLMAVCTLIASFPSVGKTDHDYATDLAGFRLKHNWIFYEADHHKSDSSISSRTGATGVPFGFECT